MINDLTRNLVLSKESTQLLSSRLREHNLITLDIIFYWYRNRYQEFKQFYSLYENSPLVYCCKIKGLIEVLGVVYEPSKWKLFIDSSRRSLKARLLLNGNFLGSVSLDYFTHLNGNYKNMKIFLDALKYNNHY
ncbi:UNVERIFIED_CONTAM: hypothetical protein RMT77_010753 [Armadillidium vulgare]